MAIVVAGLLDPRIGSFQPGAPFMGKIKVGLGWCTWDAVNGLLGSDHAWITLGSVDH